MKKRILSFIIIILLLSSTFVYSEDNLDEGARTLLLGEYESGKILYEYNSDEKIEIASITKLMMYLVTMDQVSSGNASLDDLVKVSREAAKIGGSTFYIREGEEIKLKTLLESALVVSANDSCVAIAEHIAGTEEEFVNMMNSKAKEIGLNTATFMNSNGLPLDDGSQNQMSTKDIFTLARHVITKYPQILEITKLNRIIVPSRSFEGDNTNPLLNEIKIVDGLKTGYTDEAGYCLVSTMVVEESDENEQPFRLIGIVMGTKTKAIRKNKSLELLQYGIDNYNKVKVINKASPVKTINIDNAKVPSVDVLPQKDLYLLVKKDEAIEKEIQINDDLSAPIEKGTKVGTIKVKIGNEVESVDLIVDRDVIKVNIFNRIFRFIVNFLGGL